MSETVIVNEIFRSIQGEGTRAGMVCALVRLAGCNLRCAWCDTRYAWEQGTEMEVAEILARVAELHCPLVEVTGGEPLVQPGAIDLLKRLCDVGYETLLETNGSLDISAVDSRVVRIVDFKCPSSGQSQANRWENADVLTPRDEVKFIIADRGDFDFAVEAVRKYRLDDRCTVIFSPTWGLMELPELARLIIACGLDVRLGLQLHKIIWPDVERGV